jgi:endonuclease G
MFIDFGWRERGGRLIEEEKCIRVHVIEKITPGPQLEAATEAGKTRGPIPDTIAGFPVDIPQGDYALHQVRWSSWWSRPTPAQTNPRARRHAPMQGGISISSARLRGYGTLGGQVTDRKTGKKMILSNWHVLAGQWHAQPGWPVYQPGRGDGGTGADTVASLSRHAMDTNLDAAVAELTGSRQLLDDQYGLSPVTGVGWAQLGMKVLKSGRKTDLTYGLVTGVEGTIRMSYSGLKRLIRNVLTIEPRPGQNQVSAGGDSGSFWLEEETMRAVGLHFAGSDHPERALAIDMPLVLDVLNVNLP